LRYNIGMTNEHTVLYRKYRPTSFDEVFGQDHIVTILKGSLALGNIGHAYLFSGPRGTGKTTMARILATELNCDPTDIVEIDAASNRGIDDIRQLREGVRSLPFASPYKMYIIDEVHMLTKEAFNALLKTLEEPPAHVIFVLATTELHKVLPTVISRCQSFVFRSPTQQVLKDMLRQVGLKEGFTIEEPALELIALLGNGSFRDAQGVLQKITSYSTDKVITRDEVALASGAPSEMLVVALLQSVARGDQGKALEIVKQAEQENIDPYVFLEMVVASIRNILYMRFSPELRKQLGEILDQEEFTSLDELSRTGATITSAFLKTLLEVYQHMHVSVSKYVPLEIALWSVFEQDGKK